MNVLRAGIALLTAAILGAAAPAPAAPALGLRLSRFAD